MFTLTQSKAAMHNLFHDIMIIKGANGVILFSHAGKMIYKEFSLRPPSKEIESERFWAEKSKIFEDIQECEILYETARLYIKNTSIGIFVIWVAKDISVALVRLHCDILAASLDRKKPSQERKWGLFKKKSLQVAQLIRPK